MDRKGGGLGIREKRERVRVGSRQFWVRKGKG